MESEQIFKFKPNLQKRILGTIIDYGILIVIGCCCFAFLGNEECLTPQVNAIILLLSFFWFIYFVCVESYFGATFGHRIFNLKVLKINREPIGFSKALKRHLLDFIDFNFYAIPAILAIKKTDKHQRLGDLWADTIVVDTKDPQQYSVPV